MTRERRALLLGIALLIAFAVRFHAIDRWSTGYDEVFTVSEANGLHPGLLQEGVPFTASWLQEFDDLEGAKLACLATDGGNGILYILPMHVWTDVLGNSNFSIRCFSLVCGLLVVWAIFLLTRALYPEGPTAFIAVGLAALTPLLVDYSQEARVYMLAAAASIGATFQFTRVIRSERMPLRVLLLYGVLAGVGLLLHYHTAYVILGHVVFVIWSARRWTLIKWMLVPGLVALVMVLLWLQAGGSKGLENMVTQNAIYTKKLAEEPDYFAGYRKATPVALVQDVLAQLLWLGGNGLFPNALPLRVMGLLMIIQLLILFGLRYSIKKEQDLVRLLMVLSLIGPVYCALTSALAGHTFGMRYYYAIFSQPYMIILLAVGLQAWLWDPIKRKRILGWGLATAQVCLMGASLLHFYRSGYRGNDLPEQVGPSARVVTHLVTALPGHRLSVVHHEAREALNFSLHLGTAAASMPQVWDPNSPHGTMVVDEATNGRRTVIWYADPIPRPRLH